VFCATEITQFSMVSSFMECHFGAADKWDVYAVRFMTHKLFVLCRNKAPNCYTHRSVWKHLLLLCDREGFVYVCVCVCVFVCVCVWCVCVCV
jgi:transcriptional regulator